ncbi:MAG: energy transducer TonB [Bacteroidetes bacterium]|nr:energy transducer TonB [Bacteroidota bacterium]
MRIRNNSVRLAAAVLLIAATLSAQPRIEVRSDILHLGGAGVPSAEQDTSGAPPDYVPVDKEPTIVSQSIPKYPAEAIKDNIEGRVWVKLWVDKDGAVRDAKILKSNEQIFNKPAIDAAMKYRFTPAMLRDKPVAVWVVIPFTFKLTPDTAATSELSRSPEQTRAELTKALKFERSYQDMIWQYDAAMYFERVKNYRKAAKSYQEFVKESEQFPAAPEEMVRHARLMIQKYETMRKNAK